MTGTTMSALTRCSSIARSVASGSNRRCRTSVVESVRPRLKCARPQEWNIGAAIIVRSRARSGIMSSSAAAGSSELGLLAPGALRRAGRAAGEDDDAAGPVGRRRAAPPRESSCSGMSSAMYARACQARARLGDAAPRTPRRRRSRGPLLALADLGDLRAGERGVEVQRVRARLRRRRRVASTKPRWLRHRIATPSPWPMPSAASGGRARSCACTSAKVSVPGSSTIAGSSG